MSNHYTRTSIEFHILQSFPVSCLNRDDVGAPKSAVVGGVPRARVSSQCWKRAVRMELHELGVHIASRTRKIVKTIADECLKLGATPEQADACGEWTAKAFTEGNKKKQGAKQEQEQAQEKEKKGNTKVSDTLFFISESEAKGIAAAFQAVSFAEIKDKELQKICKKAINPVHDGLDIALFGRMVANAADMNIEAAASFAHAISTHRVDPEIDFFTAVDDCKEADNTGSAHMGLLEFNSATYYRYISLDLGQLAENLKSDEIAPAVDVFTRALFLACPAARQATMAAMTPWDYAIVAVRRGQRLQLPFNTPVRGETVATSIAELKKRFETAEKMYGSLFGLQRKLEIGAGLSSIDELTAGLRDAIGSL